MRTCGSCGHPLDLEDDDVFCSHCGAFTQEEHEAPGYIPVSAAAVRRTDLAEFPDAGPSAFSRYGQVSEGEYLKYLLLMLIPVFGLIAAIRKSFMDGRETFRSFAAAICILHLMIWGAVALRLFL